MGSRLLTEEKIARVMEAKDFEDAMRVLQELGYGSSVSGKASFEQLIESELQEADSLLEFLSPSDVFIQIMRATKDYHNIKVLIKLQMKVASLDSAELFPGNIGIDTLRRAIAENDYHELPEDIRSALLYIDRQFAAVPDVSVIGAELDQAYSREVNDLVAEMNDPLVSSYFTAYFDLSNIIAFMRVRAFYSKESFDNVYLAGGSIDKKVFLDAFELSDDNVFAAIAKGEYARVLSSAIEDYRRTGSLYMLEKAKDDYLLELIKRQRHDMFGIGPLMCYYIAKQREAEAVRMAMTAKQGGIDPGVAAQRMKQLF